MDKQIYSVSIDEIIPIIRERLSVGKSARFSPRGISMLPMLRQGIDSVVISPINGDIKKYDLALYMRDNGKYILHRVIETGSTYTCIGDNQFIPEKNINKDQFIGVVTELLIWAAGVFVALALGIASEAAYFGFVGLMDGLFANI